MDVTPTRGKSTGYSKTHPAGVKNVHPKTRAARYGTLNADPRLKSHVSARHPQYGKNSLRNNAARSANTRQLLSSKTKQRSLLADARLGPPPVARHCNSNKASTRRFNALSQDVKHRNARSNSVDVRLGPPPVARHCNSNKASTTTYSTLSQVTKRRNIRSNSVDARLGPAPVSRHPQYGQSKIASKALKQNTASKFSTRSTTARKMTERSASNDARLGPAPVSRHPAHGAKRMAQRNAPFGSVTSKHAVNNIRTPVTSVHCSTRAKGVK